MTHQPVQTPLNSPFGRHSTATEVLADIDLTGRTALVTGGYSGLGLAMTRALAKAGARVLVPARRPEAARRAVGDIRGVEVGELDLADLAGVAAYGRGVLDERTELDVIICAAGVMAMPETRTGPGWEGHFAINHLGHFALVNRLIPTLRPGARVVSVASSGHFLSGMRWDDIHFADDYDPWLAYAQSKTANALFALHLDGLAAADGIRAFSVHPGSILTPLQRHVPEGRQRELGWITGDGRPAPGFKTPEQGAATAVWAATAKLLDGLGGLYCQDCDVASPADTDDMLIGGVKPWATDRVAAGRLWDLSAESTGVEAFA